MWPNGSRASGFKPTTAWGVFVPSGLHYDKGAHEPLRIIRAEGQQWSYDPTTPPNALSRSLPDLRYPPSSAAAFPEPPLTTQVAVNFSNANKSIEMTPQEIGTAYLAATATSVGLAVGLTRLVPRLRVSAAAKNILSKLVPFAAVASAGVVNISCIRWKEMRDGVDVFALDKAADGSDVQRDLGKSPRAGQMAVMQSAASRVLTNIPTLIIPPMVMTYLQHRGAFVGPRGHTLATLTQLTLIGLSLGLFLPPAIAYFPQRAKVSTDKLEDKFHDLHEDVYFNKGL